MQRKTTSAGYERKFAGFIRACEKARADKIPHLIIARPEALGDSYDEIIESLRRLAKARLALMIAPK